MNHWSKILPPLPSSPFFTYRPQNFRQPRAGRSLRKLSSNLVLKAGPSNRLPKAPSGLVPNHFQGREFHHFQHLLLTDIFFLIPRLSSPWRSSAPSLQSCHCVTLRGSLCTAKRTDFTCGSLQSSATKQTQPVQARFQGCPLLSSQNLPPLYCHVPCSLFRSQRYGQRS